MSTNAANINIQWYPGHMTKTRRMMTEDIKLVDIVIELLDARIPLSSKNPDIDKMAANKKRLIVLNKSDLADDKANESWRKYFKENGFEAICINSVSGKGMNQITDICRAMMQEKIERLKKKGRIFVPIRAMIVGVPNVGKSTLINKFVGKGAAKTGDKPGVTRGKQWIRIKKDFELLDTPGILWPKFDDESVGIKLAATGAINDNILDKYTLAIKLIDLLLTQNNSCLERYKIEGEKNYTSEELLRLIAVNRAFRTKGGEPDTERASIILLDEYRGGKLGKISLETPLF